MQKYVIRSKAALETAEYVIAADEEQSLLEKSQVPFRYSSEENLIALFAISAIATIPLPFHCPS